MTEHCGRLIEEFRGRAVPLIPELESLVVLSRDLETGVTTYRCAVCHQVWEEEYTTSRNWETLRVRKVSGAQALELSDPELISEAIVVWTGKGHATRPARDEALLVQRFGETAVDLLPLVRGLKDDFYESDAANATSDLVEMGDLAAKRFRRRHPELTEEAVAALLWCYSYDHR